MRQNKTRTYIYHPPVFNNEYASFQFDKTPEQYLADNDMKDTFNYGLLLKNFGAEELEEQLLSDQGKWEIIWDTWVFHVVWGLV